MIDRSNEVKPSSAYAFEEQKRSPLPALAVGGVICGVLGYGLYQFVRGADKRASNRAMLWRVGVQGAGVLGLLIGVKVYDGPFIQGLLYSPKE